MNKIQRPGTTAATFGMLWLVSAAACHVDTTPTKSKSNQKSSEEKADDKANKADDVDAVAKPDDDEDGSKAASGEASQAEAATAGADASKTNPKRDDPSPEMEVDMAAEDAGNMHEDSMGEGSATSCEQERDHNAILTMTGTFDVSFYFEEVEAIADGYELQPPYETGGSEVVYVLVEDSDFVSLQHLLVVPSGPDTFMVIKHWRQDWRFEQDHLLSYQGDRVWEWTELPEHDVACSWTQAVYQVDDGPRYESFGRWVHEEAASTWQSATTLRPLPRREEERALEYDVIKAVNTHIVRKDGWTHDEDNLKWLLESDEALVREHGRNDYVRADFTPAQLAITEQYRGDTAAFWQDVRDIWDELLQQETRLRVHELVDDLAVYDVLLPLAETDIASAPADQRREQLTTILTPYVEPLENE